MIILTELNEQWIKFENMKELLIEIWTGNSIAKEGAIMISELLRINTTLTELNLSSDEFNTINKYKKGKIHKNE